MRTASLRPSVCCLLAALACAAPLTAQSITGTIQGIVVDNQGRVVPAAPSRRATSRPTRAGRWSTDAEGIYRFLNMPVGNYELTVELSGFSKYVRSGLTLSLNQDAVVDVRSSRRRVVGDRRGPADAPLLNTTNAEVGVRFDTKRIAELPVMQQPRHLHRWRSRRPASASSAAARRASRPATNFSSNGMRLRSNNFMIDGQDSNDPSVTGRQQPINNTDIIQEVRLITNQFAAEFGRAAGSVSTSSPRAAPTASAARAFWFHNDDELNARSNLDKAAGRTERRSGRRTSSAARSADRSCADRTFFFGSFQRWTRSAARLRLHAQRRADRRRAAQSCSRPRAAARRCRRC